MEANNKACREALQAIVDYLEPIRKWAKPSEANGTIPTALFAAVDTVYAKAKAALAEPVRNCDVGTVDEQIARYIDFCAAHRCHSCPARDASIKCQIIWMQMPYEEGGAE